MKKFFICALIVAALCVGTASAEFGSTDSSNLSSINSRLNYVGKSVAELLYEIESDTDYLQTITSSTNALNYLGFSLNNTMKDEIDSLQSLIGTGSSAYPSLMSYLARTNILLTDLGDILTSTESGSINDLLNKILTQSTTTATYQKYLANTVTAGLWKYDENGNRVKEGDVSNTITNFIAQIYTSLMWDGINPYTNDKTLYACIAQMQKVLASDDDLALAESQKSNREEIEDSFLNGSSSNTSLSSSDFADIAEIGGIVSSSISDAGSGFDPFIFNLNQTNLEAEGWFSAACRDSLDTVTFSVSSYSLRDPDPYNMAGFTDRYESVKGGYEFDY